MSESNTQRKPKPEHKHTEAHVDTPPAASATLVPGTYAPGFTAPTDTVSTEFKEAGVTVELPRQFGAGFIMADSHAKVEDSAWMRQFTNNINANAKARAERLKAATTDAERAANQPYTVAEILALYMDYEGPAIGGTRTSTIEKMRERSFWLAWLQMGKEHNDNLIARMDGDKLSPAYVPILPKLGNRMFVPPSGKGVQEARENTVKLLQERTSMVIGGVTVGQRVQEQLDMLLAEAGKQKDKPAGVTATVEGSI